MATHIFVDNANIFGGAQRAAKVLEPTVPWHAIRIEFKNFFELLEHGQREVRTRVLGGSVPPGNEQLWEHARKAGYDTDLLKRVDSDDGRLVEQGVDELLHLKIANVLLDYKPPQTLVLGTGDGSRSAFGTSFRDQVVRALGLKWSVRVFSWNAQLSNKLRSLDCNTVDMKLQELDGFYPSLTFTTKGRAARPLKLTDTSTGAAAR
ncbi:MAG: NYN domain-containing protein [Myxococcaceae bacterium]|nr:NYN domain-containing protein [Myxococcaceae bacterium]